MNGSNTNQVERFSLWSKYYRREEKDQIMMCSGSIIVRSDYEESMPDVTFFLGGPGYTRPVDNWYLPPVHTREASFAPFTKAKPGKIHEQLIRLMDLMGWNQANLIYLTDICALGFQELGQTMKEVEKSAYSRHSFLSPLRSNEWGAAFNEDIPVINVWGQSKVIEGLATRALDKLNYEQIPYIGLRSPKTTWGYRHPYPKLQSLGRIWLQDMQVLLEKQGIVPRTNRLFEKAT
ncbi:hypothetical protein FLK61_26800 [Paenalkalicoccus suaedae]|uniref:DUF1643 domain-containing protein n=1 Tax=Paenalkalicoccus suaedae TaxID=2592382 RepID=A0A859FBF3_9BACI|nr:hypothetical protein [Paenalkalicoccus suaedae]QKS70367.1 hypothetical protein FLK61_26800 [Paenalkalicoccus suaedae]